ncbi:MAG: HAMP domain-containing sensor histidine kinase [Deltaproteobacteria bacterium]|nr:HAMP domain-containing sensor histidine kinase [Deltaproteobacteria bacterium]
MSSTTTDHAAAAAAAALDGPTLHEKRRLLVLVRTGLTLAIGYLLIFSTTSAPPPALIAFVVAYIASNIIIALLPGRWLSGASFDVILILADTAAISFSLLLIPDANTDVFVFYFTIILLASISDRLMLSLLAPIVTSGAYLAFLLARHGLDEVLQPAILLRLPFFLLTGTFYGFFVDRVRRGQVAVAAARQRAQARTELLSLITHDLKQPLWVATQSAAMLYDQLAREAAPTRELAAQVLTSLKRMEALTLNFLDLSKLEARGLKAAPRRTPLDHLIEDVADAYAAPLEAKRLLLQRELTTPLPPAWVDPLQTERCLGNLLDNAIKYTPSGGVITLRTADEGDWISVTIGDSGPGISPEREGALFAPFQDGADAAGRRSTGLGLHIARALVESMGGDIALDRDHERGAWFRLRFPTAREERRAPLPASAAA